MLKNQYSEKSSKVKEFEQIIQEKRKKKIANIFGGQNKNLFLKLKFQRRP